ncbi:MAG: hypothetical protein JNJ69_04345 [Leptospiraceae bacterium]|nr:hypothetical protein [Leptospiraceae bacterium]
MRRLSFITLLCWANAAGALDFASYNPVTHDYALQGHVHYYFEEYNEQQPHEALELLRAGQFTRSPAARLSLGYTRKAVWVAIPVAADTTEGQRLILEITALIDSIEFHYLDELGIRLNSYTTGRDYPMSTRPLQHHSFIFPITPVRPKTTAKVDKATLAKVRLDERTQGKEEALRRGVILMRLKSQGSMLIPLRLTPESLFYEADRLELLIFGFYFGIMLVMVLYNLFLYGATRERSYAFYVFYILFFLLFQFSLWGFFHQLILPEHPRVAKYALPVFLHLATIFQLLFAAQFFQARQIIPWQYRISGYLSFITFLSLIAGSFLPYRIFITIGIFSGMGAAILILVQSLTLYIKKVKAARFFLVAYVTLIAGVIFLTLRNLGVLNYSFVSTYSAQIGSALEVVLLSLALADKINIWRNEKEAAQKQVIDREREMNRAFQLFVPQKFLELAGETDFTRLELGKSTTREITILFSDIRSFTTLSESMTPEQNFKFLNSYLSRMGPIIRQNGGFIDKFIGDAIMALFPEAHGSAEVAVAKDGVQAATEAHGSAKVAATGSTSMQNGGAVGAANAALALRAELLRYNEHRKGQGYAPIDIGIGIHTGTVRLGTIGENERWEGTVIGDTVNLASRIENLSSAFNAPIVVSEALLKVLKNPPAHRELDTIRVKGKKKAVTVYEILPDEE